MKWQRPKIATLTWWGCMRAPMSPWAMLAGPLEVLVGTPMPDRSKVRGQTKSNLPALQVWGFCIGLTTLSCKKLLLRKQQRVTYKNHLCRKSLRNPCHGQQWMPRVKTPETLQVIGFEWLTVAKAERKPLSWQREPSAQKQLHWLAFGMCEQCMSKVGWRRSLLKLSVTNLISQA